jgi:membrane fusion protein, multidrug efflux system
MFSAVSMQVKLASGAAIVLAALGVWYWLGGTAGGPAGAPVARAIPVEIGASRTQEVAAEIEAVGTALASESITVTAKSNGLIKKIAFRDGQKVTAGQILVELDAAEIEAKLQEMRAARDNARQNYERAKALVKTQAMAQAKVEELTSLLAVAEARIRAEEAKLADTVVRAPFAGRLGLRQVSLGALVKPGDPITTLDDAAVIRLDFEIPETALSVVLPGAALTATSAAVAGRKFEGRVTTIDSRVDPLTRSIRVRADIPNTDESLKPGMFLTIVLATSHRPSAVVVPEEAVVAFAGQQYVFAVRDGRASRTRVVLGQRLPGAVEIVEGLAANVDIVVGGLQQVRDGMPVTPVVLPPAAGKAPATGAPGRPSG